MKRLATLNAVLMITLLVPLAGLAQEPVYRCHSDSGAAAFGDAPCLDERDAIAPAVSRVPAIAKNKTAARTGKYFAAEEARAVAFGRQLANAHRLPRDEATMKSARMLTASLEVMSVAQRRQELATFAVYP